MVNICAIFFWKFFGKFLPKKFLDFSKINPIFRLENRKMAKKKTTAKFLTCLTPKNQKMQTKKQINNQEVKLPKGKISISSRTMDMPYTALLR